MNVRKPLPKLVKPDPLERWNVLAISDLSEPLPAIPWVCESLGLAPGAVTLVAGYGYSRKTMAMQSLGLSVAAGKPVWNVFGVRKGPFVHLDYEQGRRLTQERYQRLARGMGFDLPALEHNSLRVACMPHAYLDEDKIFDELVDLVGDATLVLVDSLRAAFPHADENSSEVRAHLDVLTRVSERTKAAMVVIHHARKPNAQNGGGVSHAIRGSSALFDACQTVYVFEGEKDTPTRVHHQKDRVRGSTMPEFGLVSEDVPEPGYERSALVVRHLEPEQLEAEADRRDDGRQMAAEARIVERIIATLGGGGGSFTGSVQNLKALVAGRTELFRSAWARLIADGKIIRSGSYHTPTWSLLTHQPLSGPSGPSGPNAV